MSVNYELLFWNEGRGGDDKALLTPWLYEDHKSEYDKHITVVEATNPVLAKEIRKAYERNERRYHEFREKIDEDCAKKQAQLTVQMEERKKQILQEKLERAERAKRVFDDESKKLHETAKESPKVHQPKKRGRKPKHSPPRHS